MTRIWLVRHGEPSAAIGRDPGLTARGHEQAAALVEVLAPAALLTSPLRRARETAAPLARAWRRAAVVADAVRELPSPAAQLPDERGPWLRRVLGLTFAELGDEQRAWRDGILHHLRSCPEDTVITTHAVVINAVVGAARGDERVLHMRPAHTSITVVDIDPSGVLTVVERGRQSDSFLV
jgi:broad specificity phosphatase PhoE